MKRVAAKEKREEITWHEDRQTLTLEGEPVLTYRLRWPELIGTGLGGKWISRYYARQSECWRKRWQTEVYWDACLQMVQYRSVSKPFVPWQGELTGVVTLWEEGRLGIRMEGEETRGNGKRNRVYWGDVWEVKTGAPCLPKEFAGGRGWKKRVLSDVLEQGRQRLQSGQWHPDQDWEGKVARELVADSLCLTQEGVEVMIPQGSIAPCAEGIPVFCIKNAPPEPTGSAEIKKQSK